MTEAPTTVEGWCAWHPDCGLDVRTIGTSYPETYTALLNLGVFVEIRSEDRRKALVNSMWQIVRVRIEKVEDLKEK